MVATRAWTESRGSLSRASAPTKRPTREVNKHTREVNKPTREVNKPTRGTSAKWLRFER